jgi:hypothetical protein
MKGLTRNGLIDAAVGGSRGFPERIVSSVIEGVRRRLRVFAHATR